MSEAMNLDQQSHVRQRSLDNGLQVVWEEDHRQPLVAIEARIKGGLRGEGSYVGTGITHFIEHMLFKGTPTRPVGSIEQEVRRYGGTINAFTSFDTTGVTLFVDSRYLREALGLLSDILQHAVFNEQEFAKERAVIISEIQMNLDDPDRRLQQLFWSRHFLEHPYRHPILGYQPLLERLTVNDLRAFYAAQYQPHNIVVACVGDLDGAAFPALATDVFASWARGTTDPRQQLVPVEPPTASAKETTLELPVQAAYVLLGFSSTRLSDPDLYPLDVLASILGRGNSSRLYETIVRQRQLAHDISAWNFTPYDPGALQIAFRTDPEKVAAARDAVVSLLEEIKRRGVTDGELRKAKRMVSAEYLFNLQSVESRAADVANSLVATGDPLFSRHYVSGIASVSARDVQAVARRYCDATKMTTAIVQPPHRVEGASTSAQPSERTPVTKEVLANGATILLGVDHHLPIATIVVAFRGGVRVEDEATQGLSNLVSQLLVKGTQHQDALAIAKRVESLGAALEPFSGRDGFGVSLQLLAEDLDEGLPLIAELISQSTFPERELELERELITKAIDVQDDEIFSVGGRLLRRTLFGQHPYRFDPLGDKAAIRALTRTQSVEFAKRWMVPSNAVVAVFGDINAASVTQQLQHAFGRWPSGTAAWPKALEEAPLDGVRRAAQAMEKEQALIMLGFRGTTLRANDRDALDVMTAILSGMAGRLFQAVREEHGLSYTLGAVHLPGWDPGSLVIYAATRPQETARVLTALEDQLQVVRAKGFTQQELEEAKRYLIGTHRLELQQVLGLAKRAALDELYGLGFNAWTTYEDRIQAITVDQVSEVARRYLTMGQHVQIIVSPNGRETSPQSIDHSP